MFYSPLRYPGGKNKLSAFIAKICVDNNINGHYIEPYSGGASVALFLLLEGYVGKITINDRDRSIYAFWHSVLNNTNKLCKLIEDAELTIEEWRKQKKVQLDKEKSNLLDLGFSTFYLNRTNRSGIINAGVMGGIEQKGNYLMDCRFNKPDLIERIKRIAKYKKNIRLYKKDAIRLIDKVQQEAEDENVVFYFDPPYYLKASTLYMNHYQYDSHKEVSDKIKDIKNIKWIVSYDNVPQIQELYSDCSKKEFSFKHTAYKSREGKEVLFFSNNILEPKIENYDPMKFKKEKATSNIVYIRK
ncbi:DNA adenine methylase [Tenacibaculum aestuarii]|uniref:DNA adenine methylase n=1 Tax=Tenacibaculum aestuarii TaxID=362781 RepID=UPI00389531EC